MYLYQKKCVAALPRETSGAFLVHSS